MIARALVVIVSILACVSSAAAQQSTTINGSVIDDRTGQPLKGVLLYVENEPVFTETAEDGRFSLTLAPGRHSIAASLIGYALLRTPIDVRPNSTTPLIIRLAEGAGTYTERVTVTGQSRSAAEDSPGGSAVFGRELQNLRGVMLDDPLRAVQALPSATATDDFYSEFAVRGNSFRHVGLTIDGVASHFLTHTVNDVVDGGSIAMVNSETLGAIALLPGSYPQKTGRSLGAQLELLTREGNRDRFRGRVGLSGTSANVLTEGPLPGRRGAWLVSARRSYLDYVIKRIDPEASFAFGFTDTQAKLVYDLTPRHQLQLTTVIGRAVFEEGEPNLASNDNARATSRAWLSIVSWRWTPAAALVVTNKAYTTGERFINVNDVETPLDSGRWVRTGWRSDASYALGRAVVEFGGDLETQSARHTRQRFLGAGNLTLLGDYDETGMAASGYAQVRFTGSRLTVTPGARLDHWSLTHSTTGSPWLNAEYRLDENTLVRGGTGVYRQFAEFDQVFGLNGGGRGLHPERATHVDLGVERRLGRQTRLQVTGYTRAEAHVLWPRGSEPRRLSGGGVYLGRSNAPWVNALNGKGRGVELVLRRDAPSGLSGWAGYSYGRLRYTDVGTGESYWANADQRHTLSLYGHYPLTNRTSTGVKYRYGSNYPLTGYVGEAPAFLGVPGVVQGQPNFYALTDRRNTLRLPAYSRLDVRADHAFLRSSGRRLVLFVELANVFNHTNRRNTPFDVDRAGRVFNATETLMPIIPSAGFVLEF